MLIDCHCHSIYSKHWFWGFDSLNTPQEIVKVAVKKGLGGIAITDHNTIKGSLVARKFAKKYKGFIVITGSEIRTKTGKEVIGLGIKEEIKPNLEFEETVEKIHEAGGIAVLPHPFGKYIFKRCTEKDAKLVDAIEVFNSTLLKIFNEKASSFAKKFKKARTAGSDAHSIKEVGNACIICNGDPIEEIMKGRVKIIGRVTPFKDIVSLISKKFLRSIEWRISRTRGKYI